MREETLLRLVGLVYDAATDVRGWLPFLRELTNGVGGSSAGLLQHQVGSSTLLRGAVTASWGLDPAAAERYAAHYSALDPWGNALAGQGRLSGNFLFTSESLVPVRALKRTAFYNDFARHYDIAGNVGFGAATEPGVATTVTVLRGERMAPFGPDELRVMAALQPHISRALRVHSRLHEAVQQAAGLERVIERLPTGVVLLGERGRVLVANRIARSLAAACDGFLLDADGPSASDRRNRDVLRRLVALAADPLRRGGGVVRLSRPSGRAPLLALVSPMTNPAPLGLAVRPLVAVFVTDPEAGPVLDGDTLKTTYRLSPVEAQIAQRLVWGENLRDIAQAQGLTPNTTRWYVKQILQKTHARSQADAVRVLLTGPAAIASDTGS